MDWLKDVKGKIFRKPSVPHQIWGGSTTTFPFNQPNDVTILLVAWTRNLAGRAPLRSSSDHRPSLWVHRGHRTRRWRHPFFTGRPAGFDQKTMGLWIQPVKMVYPWICILFGITTVSINTLKLVILKRFIFSRMWKILIGIKVRETTKIVRKGNHPDWLTNFSPSYIPLQ